MGFNLFYLVGEYSGYILVLGAHQKVWVIKDLNKTWKKVKCYQKLVNLFKI